MASAPPSESVRRTPRSRPTASAGRPRSIPEDFNESIEWTAKIVQPKEKIDAGSVQPVVAYITAPVMIGGSNRVRFLVDGIWLDGEWKEDGFGHRRHAVANLPSTLTSGNKRVKVRIYAGMQVPTLTAGRIRVRG